MSVYICIYKYTSFMCTIYVAAITTSCHQFYQFYQFYTDLRIIRGHVLVNKAIEIIRKYLS